MRIGLIGFCFVNANMGCEALSYSFIQMIEECLPDEKIQICLFEEHEELGAFPEYFSNIAFTACHIQLKDIHRHTLKEMKKCDFLFDITYGDGFSDIYYRKYAIKTIAVKAFEHFSGRKFILLPQTYGPFKNWGIEKLAMKTIQKADYVYSRDALSAKYIKQKIKRDVPVYTDLALYLKYCPEKFEPSKIHVGINVSGLLYRGGFHTVNQFALTVNYKAYIDQLINNLLNDDKYEIHIIPHVIETIPYSNDGDVDVCKSILKKHSGVIMAPVYENPISIKNYIAGMDVFTGARMHSTIAAFSAGVPTIPFAYSRKFQGLYDSLEYPHYIDASKMNTEQAVRKTIDYIEKRLELKQCVSQSMLTVKKQLNNFKSELERITKLD